MADRRSPILAASVRYWAWLGALLAEWTHQLFGSERRRSWFVFGGCFAWLFIVFFYVLLVFVFATLVASVVLTLALVGCLLSIVGGLDQARISVLTRRSARPRGPGASVGGASS